jgi:hypothetical protein
LFAIGSTPCFDDGALGSFHGSRRVTQFLQWASPPPLARVTQVERCELRLAVSSAAGSESLIEGGSVRAHFEQSLLRWRALGRRTRAAERPLCALRHRRRHCVVDLPARGRATTSTRSR